MYWKGKAARRMWLALIGMGISEVLVAAWCVVNTSPAMQCCLPREAMAWLHCINRGINKTRVTRPAQLTNNMDRTERVSGDEKWGYLQQSWSQHLAMRIGMSDNQDSHGEGTFLGGMKDNAVTQTLPQPFPIWALLLRAGIHFGISTSV